MERREVPGRLAQRPYGGLGQPTLRVARHASLGEGPGTSRRSTATPLSGAAVAGHPERVMTAPGPTDEVLGI